MCSGCWVFFLVWVKINDCPNGSGVGPFCSLNSLETPDLSLSGLCFPFPQGYGKIKLCLPQALAGWWLKSNEISSREDQEMLF